MNSLYRLIWNDLTRVWVGVSEHTPGRGKRAARRSGAAARALFPATALALISAAVFAASPQPPAATQLPTGGQVVAGSAAIQQGASLERWGRRRSGQARRITQPCVWKLAVIRLGPRVAPDVGMGECGPWRDCRSE
jgi:hypothetical protein